MGKISLILAAACLALSAPACSFGMDQGMEAGYGNLAAGLVYEEVVDGVKASFKVQAAQEEMTGLKPEPPATTRYISVAFKDIVTGKALLEGEARMKVVGPDKMAQSNDLMMTHDEFGALFDLSKSGKYGVMVKFRLRDGKTRSARFWYVVQAQQMPAAVLPPVDNGSGTGAAMVEVATTPRSGLLDEGLEAYKKKDYVTALKVLTPLALQENADAQVKLGIMYNDGLGVRQDQAEAAKWYRKAAEHGNVFGQFNLGAHYFNGEGEPQDFVEARKWFRKAAEQGDSDAQGILGGMYENGKGVQKDYAEAEKWYRKAVAQGNAEAQTNLGLMYEKGAGVQQNHVEAAKWYRLAAEQGDPVAQRHLGVMYITGHGVQQDYPLSVHWMRKAAEQGDSSAQNNLGRIYEYGQGVPKDFDSAQKWYRKAVEQGNPEAQSNLGLMYENGLGAQQDHAEAAKWYLMAAKQGYPVAQRLLGVLYLTGQGVPQDYGLSTHWLLKAAEQGDAIAQDNLGVTYWNGFGVEKDYAQAVIWFQKSAGQGFADAQLNLGSMYQNGLGVAQDYSEALKWFRKAAEQGLVRAEHELALANKNGLGVERDLAAYFLQEEKLALGGFPPSQFEYGIAMLAGLGTPVDKVKAWDWLNRAANAGDVAAQSFLAKELCDGSSHIKKDPAKAAIWARKAAGQGSPEAQSLLGELYRKGDGVPKSAAEALRWHLKAAESGYLLSMLRAAEMYMQNDGVPPDCEAATSWLRKARQSGEADVGYLRNVESRLDSINNGACKFPLEWAEIEKLTGSAGRGLEDEKPQEYKALEKEILHKLTALTHKGVNAARCEMGRLVAHDTKGKEGLDLLMEGADRGGLNCMFYIMLTGDMGETLEGLSPDALQAVKLRAAEQGLTYAFVNLASSYEDGKGVEQDFVRAYMWSTLEAERRHLPADKALARLLPRLTPKKLAAAQLLIKEWKLKHPALTDGGGPK